MNSQIYFALWAEDINQYLNTAYNSSKLSEVREELLVYISQDNDNPKYFKNSQLSKLLGMTGLSLDCKDCTFPYRNEIYELPSDKRLGNVVKRSFLE